jgi:hypothetical protein
MAVCIVLVAYCKQHNICNKFQMVKDDNDFISIAVYFQGLDSDRVY